MEKLRDFRIFGGNDGFTILITITDPDDDEAIFEFNATVSDMDAFAYGINQILKRKREKCDHNFREKYGMIKCTKCNIKKDEL